MWMYKLTKQFNFLVSIFFLFIGFQLQAQQNNSDSIAALLQQSSDKEKINILYNQTNSLRFNNPTKAAEYGIQAIDTVSYTHLTLPTKRIV